MCGPAAAVVGVGLLAVQLNEQRRARKQANRLANQQRADAAAEAARIRQAEADINKSFDDPALRQNIDRQVGDFLEDQETLANAEFELATNREDIRAARRGLLGRSRERGRRRLRQGLALSRGAAAGNAQALRADFMSNLNSQRDALLASVRQGGVAPGQEDLLRRQGIAIDQARRNLTQTGFANFFNQSAQAVDTNTRARVAAGQTEPVFGFLRR